MEETFEYKGHTITVEIDVCPDNPREAYDHLGTMWCVPHRNYYLGDKDAEKPSDDDIMLPLYLYDHSGITMNTTGFHCPWDSGQVGYIYVSKQRVREEYGVQRISKRLHRKVLDVLRAEVSEYDAFIRGEYYMFTVEDKHGLHVETVCGFDDFDYCKEEAIAVVDHYVDSLEAA